MGHSLMAARVNELTIHRAAPEPRQQSTAWLGLTWPPVRADRPTDRPTNGAIPRLSCRDHSLILRAVNRRISYGKNLTT